MPSGLTVADNLALLWRSFSLEYELFRSVVGWVPRIASYEVKCALVEHLHEDMRRTRALRERIADFGVFAPERRLDPGPGESGAAPAAGAVRRRPGRRLLPRGQGRAGGGLPAPPGRHPAPERRADGGGAGGPSAEAGPADRLGQERCWRGRRWPPGWGAGGAFEDEIRASGGPRRLSGPLGPGRATSPAGAASPSWRLASPGPCRRRRSRS